MVFYPYHVQSECKCLDIKRVDMFPKGKTPLAFKSLKTFILIT